MEGVVKNITEYGAFIDLGGIDGLLHMSRTCPGAA
jgi:ribosomal protein S1